MIAVGVASPGASGQVITTTVIANRSASRALRSTSPNQTRQVPTRPPVTGFAAALRAGDARVPAAAGRPAPATAHWRGFCCPGSAIWRTGSAERRRSWPVWPGRRSRSSAYTREATERCERVLVTVLGNVGPWREHIYLAGGLAPRYLVGELPEGERPHVGTTDVDLVIGLSLTDESVEAYRTLEGNLKDAGFEQGDPSFRWTREVEGLTVLVEFLCETDQVEEGRIFKPKRGTGANLSALNVAGALLAPRDFLEIEVEAERLDQGGRSKVGVRVANLLPYVVPNSSNTSPLVLSRYGFSITNSWGRPLPLLPYPRYAEYRLDRWRRRQGRLPPPNEGPSVATGLHRRARARDAP